MKKNQLICALAILAYSTHSTNGMQPTELKDLSDDTLYMILSGNNPCNGKTLTVSKKIRELNSKNLQAKWTKLEKEATKLPGLKKAIDSVGLPTETSPTLYHFSKLYVYFANLLGLSKSKPENINFTNIELYLRLEEAARNVDKDLMEIWPVLKQEMEQVNKITIKLDFLDEFGNPQSAGPTQVREFMNKPQHTSLLETITEINHEDGNLSGIPKEILNLENLRSLNLSSGNISVLSIPEGKLTHLENLLLDSHQIKWIEIPGTLNNLKRINLNANQIDSVIMPETLRSLEIIEIVGNKLKSIDMPEDLFQKLTHIDLSHNHIESLSDIGVNDLILPLYEDHMNLDLVKPIFIDVSSNKLTSIKLVEGIALNHKNNPIKLIEDTDGKKFVAT